MIILILAAFVAGVILGPKLAPLVEKIKAKLPFGKSDDSNKE